MNEVESWLPRLIRSASRATRLSAIVGFGLVIFAAAALRADDNSLDPIPAAAANGRLPTWVSPISPYDPAEGSAGAHAVRIGTSDDGGYVQTSAFGQAAAESATPAGELPPGGYIWGGTSASPAADGGAPSVSYSESGAVPPPESVGGWPATGNVMGGLGIGIGAPPGLPPLGPLMSQQPIIAMPELPPEAIHTIFRVHQSITDEVGDDGPITSIGGFFPHTTPNGLWFFDAQFSLLEDAENLGEQTLNFGANAGFGWRRIIPSLDSIFGASVWYDLDRTRPDFVHQVGISAELLGDIWQFRVNGYVPCGTNRISSFSALGAPMYVNENIVFGQTRTDNLDMGGLDWELGRRLPGWLGNNGVSAYIGGYYYQADASFNTLGISTRLEAIISQNLTIDAKYTNDHLFKNRVGLDVTWFLPAGKCKSCEDTCCSEVYRLTEPVERNRTVVYATQTLNTPVIATSPTTGLPIVVVHVDSSAPNGGNGTVQAPYNNLPAAQAGSAPNDIILVQAGSEFSGQSITLQNSQRFLGEGIPHTVDTVQAGTITLPTTSSGTVLPIINNSPADAVTLANGNEVSGFTINNSGGEAIAGNGISGTTNINNVAINGGASGISITNSSTTATITNTPINGAATGISLTNNTGSFDFVGTQTVTGSTAGGVVLSGNSSPVTFDNLQLNATTGTALSATNQTGTLTITTGAITAAAGTGVSIDNSGTSTPAPLAISLASLNATGGTNGILLNNAGGSLTVTGSGTTAGSGGTISDTTGVGVSIIGESGTVALNYMNITDPAGDGISVTNSTSTANVGLTGMAVTLAGGQIGAFVNNNSGTFSLNNSTVTGGATGIAINNSSGTANLASDTVTNALEGIGIVGDSGATTATGTTTISGSTIDGLQVDNGSGAVSFSNVAISANSGIGLESSNQTGTFTISGGTISDANGQAVRILGSGAGAPLAITLASVNSTGGVNGIALQNAAGTFTVTGTGTTAGSGGTITGTGGDGILVQNESGTASFSNMVVTNAGNNGVNEQNTAAAGTVSLTNVQINNPHNTGVLVQNNAGTANISGTSVTGGNIGLDVETNSGAVNLASFTDTNSQSGVVVRGSSGTFADTGTTTISGTTNNGAQIDNNTGTVSFNDLELSANSGTGLESSNQTGTFTISGGNISNANGTAVKITGTGATGAPLAITLTSVSSANQIGIALADAGGTFTVTGTGTTAGSGGTIANSVNDGVLIQQEVGTVSLANMNISSPGRDGVDLQNTQSTGTVSLTNLDITNSNIDGIGATANAGTLNVTNTTSSGANNYGLNLQNNSGTVTANGNTFSNNQLGGINIQNNSGTVSGNNDTLTGNAGTGLFVGSSTGTESFGTLSISGSATGISLSGDSGAVTFTGTTTVNGSTTDGVIINNQTKAVTFATLNIDATSGTAFIMTNSPTTLTITGGTITAAAGDGFDVGGDAVLNVTLDALNATGGNSGINLNTVTGSITVNGGTISNTTDEGILLNGFGNATFNNMTVSATGIAGVFANAGANLTINNSLINTETTSADGIVTEGITGTASITNNLVEFSNFVGIDLISTNAGATYHVDSNVLVTNTTTNPVVGLEDLDLAAGNNSFDISGNSMFLGSTTAGTGIDLDKAVSGIDFLSSSSDNGVIANTPFASTTGGGGSFSGTISVNGTPEP